MMSRAVVALCKLWDELTLHRDCHRKTLNSPQDFVQLFSESCNFNFFRSLNFPFSFIMFALLFHALVVLVLNLECHPKKTPSWWWKIPFAIRWKFPSMNFRLKQTANNNKNCVTTLTNCKYPEWGRRWNLKNFMTIIRQDYSDLGSTHPYSSVRVLDLVVFFCYCGESERIWVSSFHSEELNNFFRIKP